MRWGKQKKVWIPEISSRNLRRLAKRIVPVVRFKGRGLCYIEPVALGKLGDWFKPKPTGKTTDLEPLCEITTCHNGGFQGHSRPSVAEVLPQISAEHRKRAVAFEIVQILPGYERDEKEGQVYYRARTMLYARV